MPAPKDVKLRDETHLRLKKFRANEMPDARSFSDVIDRMMDSYPNLRPGCA